MVKVREQHLIAENGAIDVGAWLDGVLLNPNIDRGEVERAVEFCLASAKPFLEEADAPRYFTMGLEMAQILLDLHLDQDALVASVLYRAVREEQLSLAAVSEHFGATVAKIISGVLGMAAISSSRRNLGPERRVLGQADEQRENIRKMLVSLVDDVRVALIKLAERTCAIRDVKDNPDKRYALAREVFDIYAPLAHRLGIGHLKWELEDLSFRYLEPNTYKKIAKLLAEKRIDRQQYIEQVKQVLQRELQSNNIDGELSGRVKHIYSIWRKMQMKGIGFSQVYDIHAVRILVPEVKDCYAILGIVHGLWRNVPNEFDDYIANPKENGYRSLHTAVIGPQGKVLEVQVRTFEMHEEAEFGVCAHWQYKGTDSVKKGNAGYEGKLNWLRQVLEWHEETGEAGIISEHIGGELERVYVFTPKGDVVSLASGATPLDFAYHVHTEVGHRCRGAKVNGRIVPINYVLKTGDRVEILTAKENQPKRDWLQSDLGYLRTSRARYKVQQWFRYQAREENSEAGRALIEKSVKRLALTVIDYKRIAEKLGFNSVEDMYVAAGAGDLSASQILRVAQSIVALGDRIDEFIPVGPIARQVSELQPAIYVNGVGNMLTRLAGCCTPLPGDPISGYVTRGHGVSIHNSSCPKLLSLVERDQRRVLEVSWDEEPADYFPVDLRIEAYDRPGLLKDVTSLLSNAQVNISAVNSHTRSSTNTAEIKVSVAISGLDHLDILIGKLVQLPNVISASRWVEG